MCLRGLGSIPDRPVLIRVNEPKGFNAFVCSKTMNKFAFKRYTVSIQNFQFLASANINWLFFLWPSFSSCHGSWIRVCQVCHVVILCSRSRPAVLFEYVTCSMLLVMLTFHESCCLFSTISNKLLLAIRSRYLPLLVTLQIFWPIKC